MFNTILKNYSIRTRIYIMVYINIVNTEHPNISISFQIAVVLLSASFFIAHIFD